MLLFYSIMIMVILSFAIIRIYIILHIYLQATETEGLAELYWVIGQVYHLRFQVSCQKQAFDFF